jgi:protocatechuate 3,4-dioxygenase beta subunit
MRRLSLGTSAALFLVFAFLCTGTIVAAQDKACTPTEPDMLGPFYKSDAPVRSSVGKGYLLSGVVKSSEGCVPIKGARIEFWLAGSNGKYDDEHRATIFSDEKGSYQFESNIPGPYFGRPPHIHVKVSAKGFTTLITQHYPEKGKAGASFDLVLVPSP